LYSSLYISGYRGLDSFRMRGLGRVNLLVGGNNSGKTSILECIELLRSAGHPQVLASIAGRRGEWGYASDGDARAAVGPRPEPVDVSHLFANRQLCSRIRIEADRIGDAASGGWNDRVTVHVEERSGSDDEERNADLVGEDSPFVLHVTWSNAEDDFRARISEDGVLHRRQRLTRPRGSASQPVQFVRTGGLGAADVARTYSRFVFTDRDAPVKEALRVVEPAVEDIAPVADDRRFLGRDGPGGVVVKLRETDGQVPIGSMGDGMWRMLGLALSISSATGGVLLVDEIDTGLHYSTMEGMWRMIGAQAAALSVQVFATTHSRDCYESLAAVAKAEAGDFTIQRIDRSRGEAVRFGSEAIVAAAERDIEVR
jgi:predicted ATPase